MVNLTATSAWSDVLQLETTQQVISDSAIAANIGIFAWSSGCLKSSSRAW